MTKVYIIGNTGSGKSSLLNALVGDDLKVEYGIAKRIQLAGPGIYSGYRKESNKNITIKSNKDLNLTFYDSIDFYDEEHLITENQENKFKVILVVSDSETMACNGNIFWDDLAKTKDLFHDQEYLKKNFALVITKSNPEISGSDYIDMICDGNLNEEKEKWSQFFRSHIDQVFTFPKPPRKNVGMQYEFEEREKLIQFLQKS